MSLPDGYKLVPVEPSPSMLAAYLEADGAVNRYAAMLKAAPVPPLVDGPPSAWVNGDQLRLCAKSPRHDEPENPMLHNLPRNIAGSALQTGYCNTPLFAHSDAGEVDRAPAQRDAYFESAEATMRALRSDLASANADKNAYGQNAIDLKARAKRAERDSDTLRAQLSKTRQAFVIAVGDSSPYAKFALAEIDAALFGSKSELVYLEPDGCGHGYQNPTGCPVCQGIKP